jgi:Helix-turn-helix domain
VGDVFKALADPARRKILDELTERHGQTLFEVCSRLATRHQLGSSRQAISPHLGVQLGGRFEQRAAQVPQQPQGAPSRATSSRISGSGRPAQNSSSIWSRTRSAGDTRLGTGVGSSFVTWRS